MSAHVPKPLTSCWSCAVPGRSVGDGVLTTDDAASSSWDMAVLWSVLAGAAEIARQRSLGEREGPGPRRPYEVMLRHARVPPIARPRRPSPARRALTTPREASATQSTVT